MIFYILYSCWLIFYFIDWYFINLSLYNNNNNNNNKILLVVAPYPNFLDFAVSCVRVVSVFRVRRSALMVLLWLCCCFWHECFTRFWFLIPAIRCLSFFFLLFPFLCYVLWITCRLGTRQCQSFNCWNFMNLQCNFCHDWLLIQ